MKYKNNLAWLNVGNHTAFIQIAALERLMKLFPYIVALEVGSAYGGAVETMATYLKGRGKVYGYDTFEGHPKDLGLDFKESHAMDSWYQDPHFGTDILDYDYQRRILDENGLDNAVLVKGRVNKHSFDDIEEAHLVMIDLDMVNPTKIVYEALKDKIVFGGYLLFHDTVPADHLPLLHNYVYKEVMKDKKWKFHADYPKSYLTILQRI